MFHFKHFSLSDENAAMKIGTDAVLLGAWADINQVKTILDIGTGTGIIALMMAQRSSASIDAIEIDAETADLAGKNIRLSPWSSRIEVHTVSFQEFVSYRQSQYDLIVSNPPYFSRSLRAPDPRRNQARHDKTLPAGDLIQGAAKLISSSGRINLIFPCDAQEAWLAEAKKYSLYATRVTEVKPREGKPASRLLVELRKEPVPCSNNQLIIRCADGSYTKEYKLLTEDFYLGL